MYEKTLTPRLSFCITCKNRFHQIKQTLPKNLKDNYEHRDLIEFVLVDFGSTDGLQEWVISRFASEIESGYLKYYYTEELKNWHACIAKNTSHILANHEILVNLDCDNYTGKNGGVFVLENMFRYGYDHTVLHQFSNVYGDGSYGRIALTKENFFRVGGYDESLGPMGYQDTNLILRLILAQLNYIHIGNRRYNLAIPNVKGEGVLDRSQSWMQMNYENYKISTSNILSGRLKANGEQTHIGIIDNVFSFSYE